MLRNINLLIKYLFVLLQRKLKLIIFLLIVVAVSSYGFTKVRTVLNVENFTEGLIGTYEEKDLPEQVTKLLSKGLVKLDKSGNPQPELAESWQVNEDATIYTVKLKNNLYWIDGKKLSAYDLNLNVPNTEVSVVDDLTIQFKIADSFSPFMTFLDQPLLRKGDYVGIGPYSVYQVRYYKDDPTKISRLTLKTDDKTLTEQLTVKFYPTEKRAKTALKLGEVDSLLGVTETDEFEKEKVFAIWNKTNYEQIVTIFFNTKDPILSDENLRLALSYGAPAVANEEEAITSISVNSWAFNKDVKEYLDNPEQAKISLNKVKNGKEGPINLTTTTSLKNIADQVAEKWNSMGVKTSVRAESGVPQNFQALLIVQNIPTDPDQYSLWHSTQEKTNISGFSSPRVDKDLEDGRKISDEEARKQKYFDFQKVLLDHAPATFLYFPKYNVIYLKKDEAMFNKIINLQLAD